MIDFPKWGAVKLQFERIENLVAWEVVILSSAITEHWIKTTLQKNQQNE